MNMKVLPEHLLLRCTQCQAWPMAIVSDEDDLLTFRCASCRALESYRLGVAGTLVPARGAFMPSLQKTDVS